MPESLGQFHFLKDHFSAITDFQLQQFEQAGALYRDWNSKINLISRKDIEHLPVRHILHSLAIAKFIRFNPDAIVLDVGTGGGFPGIPLAIMFPETRFLLVDSIGKKVKVVEEIIRGTGLKNAMAVHGRDQGRPAGARDGRRRDLVLPPRPAGEGTAARLRRGVPRRAGRDAAARDA